ARARAAARVRSCPGRGDPHGVEDLRLPRAPAEIARQRLADRVVGGSRIASEQIRDSNDETGRAEAALHGARLDERFLHGMEGAVLAEPLDGDEVVTLGLRGEDEARTDERPVHQDRARPALALLARILR